VRKDETDVAVALHLSLSVSTANATPKSAGMLSNAEQGTM
jgi:hypothetical protein